MKNIYSKARKNSTSIFGEDRTRPGVMYNIDMLNDEEKIRQSFAARLSELRLKQNISAREMSLALGQGQGYINSIENGHIMPSMIMLFEICRYLQLSPREFFEYTERDHDTRFEEQLTEKYRRLSQDDRELIRRLIRSLEP